jgi:hypothetical protein
VRHDRVTDVLDRYRSFDVFSEPAKNLVGRADAKRTGQEVSERYGLLFHYTSTDGLRRIDSYGAIGRGIWLTPTGFGGCMVPYNLGLYGPKNIALLLDVASIGYLWGPGTAPSSPVHGNVWRGGGIEFYSDDVIPLSAIIQIIDIEPCGDTHHG